jgi:diketogulonate reductase-like aldo/keto reductase
MQTQSPQVNLNNDVSMPLLGLGVYDMHGTLAEKAIHTALEIGYRLIDTASMYLNNRKREMPFETVG